MAAGRLDAIGIVVGNLADGVAFYRLLGAPFAVGAEQSEHGHAEALLDGGIRLMLDSEAEIKSFDPTWRRGDGQVGGALAFRCESPAAVDELYRKGDRGWRPILQGAVGRFLGPEIRAAARP
jgi:hypothetical protein